MRVPQYWIKGSFEGVDHKGEPLHFEAWGWSNDSAAHARRNGNERARQAFLALNRGTKRTLRDEYDAYLTIPLREEIIERFQIDDQETGVITRNRYGALILNTPNVLFVDIDLPKQAIANIKYAFLSLFSSKYREKALREQHDRVIDRVLNWSKENPQQSFRLYQTRAGYRILFTDHLYDPLCNEVNQIFQALEADGLYRLLTRKQECFRARLTPKPWRVEMDKYQFSPPPTETEQRKLQEMWISEYNKVSADYQTCYYVDSLGSKAIANDQIRQVVEVHDRHVGIGQNKPLA